MGQIKNIKLHIVTDIKIKTPHHVMVNVPTSVQVFGRKKTATAVAFCKRGNGLIKVNGPPLDLVEPQTLRMKVQEPVLIIGKERFAGIDIRVSVKGGGQIAQIYAIRQAISKGIVAYYQKFVDEASKKEIKDLLVQYDRSLLVADPRRCEAKIRRTVCQSKIPEVVPLRLLC